MEPQKVGAMAHSRAAMRLAACEPLQVEFHSALSCLRLCPVLKTISVNFQLSQLQLDRNWNGSHPWGQYKSVYARAAVPAGFKNPIERIKFDISWG